MDTADQHVPVAIVGGGPVGLSMALLLERFGIDCIVVERNKTTTDHPKARGCWVRSMELFRQWGVEKPIRARGLKEFSDVWVVSDTVMGHEYGRTRPEPNLDQTPAWKCMVAQDAVEEAIFDKLRDARHAKVLFDTEMISVADRGDHVHLKVRSGQTGAPRNIIVKYLIAADGAGSGTRRAVGIEMEGPPLLAVMSNDYWKGDLSGVRSADETAGFILISPDKNVPRVTILNTNGRDRWLTVSQVGTAVDERERPWTEDQFVDATRGHVGIPDLDVRVINSSIWRVSKQVAASFRKGRIFLAGDAAHRFPPTGGFGMNSGIQDAHNLAWKLAFVIKEQASEEILETYDAERRPVAISNAEFSIGNYKRIEALEDAVRSQNEDHIRFWINDLDNHIHSIGQNLGLTYRSAAILEDATNARSHDPRRYHPSDRPGGRFPHMWTDLTRRESTIDWFDRRFVLVAGPLASEWLEAGRAASERLNLPLQLRVTPSADRRDGLEMGVRGAVLVRPDGYVAWRMPFVPSDPTRSLTDALCAILRREPEPWN